MDGMWPVVDSGYAAPGFEARRVTPINRAADNGEKATQRERQDVNQRAKMGPRTEHEDESREQGA